MSLTYRLVRFFVSVVMPVGGLLVACMVGVPASAQKNIYVESEQEREIARAQVNDFDVGGVKYRIPGSYMRRARKDGRLIASQQDSRLTIDTYPHSLRWLKFSFWISDGMAVKSDPQLEDNHRGPFWPPDPGRPNLTGEDFIVNVSRAYPREMTEGLEALRRLRVSALPSPSHVSRIESYGSLDCGIDAQNSIFIICKNPFDEEPVVHIWGVDSIQFPGLYRNLSMEFYSRADNLEVTLAFPDLGLSRWKEVICRTLSLVRQWRVSEGPAPDRCPQIGHLSMVEDKTIWASHGRSRR